MLWAICFLIVRQFRLGGGGGAVAQRAEERGVVLLGAAEGV
jgi:hypothetical protein